ncbi:hypothetical protein E3J74_02285 [Candidatus Bathyarchaeota archaeon]|nr:MAG: hypothetical protein E3J74_02285 [Candidatus Bathyarchaeota archaeon]
MEIQRLGSLMVIAVYIAILVYFIGFLLNAWTYFAYPPGNDTIPHLYKTKFITQYLPQIRWNHHWASGMPLFRWYPILFFLLQASATVITALPVELVLVITLSISYWLIGLGIYLFTSEIVNDHSISIIAPTVLISTPILWNLYVEGGLCTRIPAAGFFALSLAATIRYVNRPSRMRLLSSILCISTSMLLHPAYGVPALISCTLLTLVMAKDWRRKITLSLKIMIPTLFLICWFYLPFIQPLPPHRLSEPFSLSVTIAHIFMLPTRGADVTFNPIFIPLTLALVMISLFYDRKTLTENSLLKWVLAFLFLFPFLAQIFDDSIIMITLAFYLLPFDCLLLKRLYDILARHRRFLPNIITVCLISLILIAQVWVTGVDVIEKIKNPVTKVPDALSEISDRLTIPKENFMYRVAVAGSYSDLGGWFNYKYDVPQTRDYYGQGILNPQWNGLFSIIYYTTGNYNETNFFLDYWGVKWILARSDMNIQGTSIPHYQKFLARQQYYQLTGQARAIYDPDEVIYEFTYRNATPIFYVSNVPTLLILGDEIGYNDVFLAFAYSDYDSRCIIPIKGYEYIDDYTLSQLSQFDAIILRGYKYHDRAEAWSLLDNYVKNGGGLIIETGYSPDGNASFIPPPCPVEMTRKTDFGKEWHFTYVDSPVTDGINFTSFSPAVYGDHAWGVSASYNESVRLWARTILWNKGHPLVVIGDYGKGRVVWSGLNLPYHIINYKNYWESLFLSKIIDWAAQAPKKRTTTVDYTVNRPNPEKIIVTVSNEANGILFKECHFKNWYAYLIDHEGKRQNLPIYKAGPYFMYVRVPSDIKLPIKVFFEYGWEWEEISGGIISMITFVILVMYATGLPVDKPAKYLVKRLKKSAQKVGGWWYEE